MSTRKSLTIAVVILVVVAFSASAALVVITTVLHDAVSGVGQATDSLVFADDVRTDVLELERLVRSGANADVRERQSSRLEDRVARAEMLALGPDGAFLARDVQRHVGRLLATIRVSPAALADADVDAALAALGAYSREHAALARGERERARYWDRVANVWGLSSAALLLLGMGAVLLSIRAHLLAPLLAIADGITRFAHGSRGQRIDERGPAEIREVANAVNDMITRLEQRRDEQLAFLAGVAHDLRNPLSALRIAATSLGDGQASESRMRRIVELIQRQIDRLDRMAGDFLEAARIEAGQFEFVEEERDLREVGRAAADLYGASSPLHRLRLELPEAPLPVRCDFARIDQVANNLVSNAIKYSPDGGHIDISVGQRGNHAFIAVTDEGVGIAQEELVQIFEPFRRGARLKGAVPGLGLGLAMVRRIVERHGGRIEVASVPGRGSTFRVLLPLANSAIGSNEATASEVA